MKTLKTAPALLTAAILAACALASSALAATPAPAWNVRSMAVSTNFTPGDKSGKNLYEVIVTNNGGAVTDGSPITIVDTLPAGLTVKDVELELLATTGAGSVDFAPSICKTGKAGDISTVTCKIEEGLSGAVEPARIWPSEQLRLVIKVSIPASASGLLENSVQVEGGGGLAASIVSDNEASVEPASAGLSEFNAELTASDGSPVTTSASHPYQYTTSFAVNTERMPAGSVLEMAPAEGDLKDIEVALPPGLIGNPTSIERCTAQQFNTINGVNLGGVNLFQNECPDGSAVGLVVVQQLEGRGGIISLPLYNLVPPKGMPAQLGFEVAGAPFYVNTRLRSEGDYGVTAYLSNITEAQRVTATSVTIWGTPDDPSHDRLRGRCLSSQRPFSVGICPVNPVDTRPFFRLPTSCADPLATTMSFNTWPDPATFFSSTDTEPAPLGCDQPDFSPTIEARPTNSVADAPSGLHFNLHLPQAANEDPEGLAEADLKATTVTLPEGLLVNPASADGLGGCSAAQIGLSTPVGQIPPRFSAVPPNCPGASKIGTVEVDTPLVDHPLPGAVYLAKQSENPFGSLLAIYVTISDPRTGVVVKLPAKVSPDPQSGQLTTTVPESPQLPFEDFKLDFFAGARAPLRTPQTCGAFTTTTSLTPWSAPESGGPATPSDSFAISSAPGGGGCANSKGALPNNPSFEAGTQSPVAGAYSPFLLRLARQDGSQELKGLNVELPAGLTAKLAGLQECSEAQIAQARARAKPGEGAGEKASPSCPASSRLGTVTVGAGAGPSPIYVSGDAYLAGPYKGAPLSMAIITPAVAGPFDLGAVTVRAALHVDPETAKVSVKSDPIPTILEGIPLDVRSIAVKVDRDQFTLNPTSCEEKALTAEALSTQGQAASLSNRFQVGNCKDLGFKPKLSLRLKGGTERGDNPAFTATLKMPPRGANIARAQVALPRSVFLDQAHIRTICTRVQFAADACPKGAVYGYAKAWTPLLDQPLEGPVYLRSSNNKLPDLVADLNGRLQVVLHGKTDSIRGGIRNTFEGVPDAPASKFVLSLKGGKRGLLVNSRDLCSSTQRARALFEAHNGKALSLKPVLENSCRQGKEKRRDSKHNSKHRQPHREG
jgi:hypothetical protein